MAITESQTAELMEKSQRKTNQHNANEERTNDVTKQAEQINSSTIGDRICHYSAGIRDVYRHYRADTGCVQGGYSLDLDKEL